MTYPLDTAGMGLPVLEFRLNAPILCREEERACHEPSTPIPRGQSTWHLDSWRQVSVLDQTSKQDQKPQVRGKRGLLPKPCCKVLGNCTSGVLKVGFWASSISTRWECVRNAHSQASPGTHGSETQGWSQQCVTASRGCPGRPSQSRCSAPSASVHRL